MAAVAGAILLLSVCVLATAIAIMAKLAKVEDWLYSHEETLRDSWAGPTAHGPPQRSGTPGEPALPGLDRLVTDLGALRQEVKDAMARKSEAAAAAATRRPPGPKPPRRPQPETVEAEHLDLLLEPVIELSSGSTSHYRALINLTNGRGEVVRHAELMQKADQGGMRAALDAQW